MSRKEDVESKALHNDDDAENENEEKSGEISVVIAATSRLDSFNLKKQQQQKQEGSRHQRYQQRRSGETRVSQNKLLSSNSTMTEEKSEDTNSVDFHAGEEDNHENHDIHDSTNKLIEKTIAKKPSYNDNDDHNKHKNDRVNHHRKLKTSQSEGQMTRFVDDDYYSSDEEKVYDEDDLRFTYLGIYEKSNLGERLAQSEKDLQNQRSFLVSTFMNTYGLKGSETAPASASAAIPATIAFEEEEDENDPALVLEKQPASAIFKQKYKNLKQKNRNRFNKVILAVPKTRHMQKKILERRILSNEEIENRFTNAEKEKEVEKTIADKLKEKLNLEPTSPNGSFESIKTGKPMFFGNGTGKMKFRIRTMLNNVKY